MKLLNFKNLDELTNKIKTEKSCIIGLVNRDTKQVRAYKVSNNEKDNLLPKVYLNCKDKSNIFTDSYNGYDDLKKYDNHEFDNMLDKIAKKWLFAFFDMF